MHYRNHSTPDPRRPRPELLRRVCRTTGTTLTGGAPLAPQEEADLPHYRNHSQLRTSIPQSKFSGRSNHPCMSTRAPADHPGSGASS